MTALAAPSQHLIPRIRDLIPNRFQCRCASGVSKIPIEAPECLLEIPLLREYAGMHQPMQLTFHSDEEFSSTFHGRPPLEHPVSRSAARTEMREAQKVKARG